MNDERVIRQAKEKDLETVLAVINETNRITYKAIIPPERFEDPFMSLDELAKESDRMDFFLCEVEGRTIGVGALENRGSGVGIIYRLYVLPALQRSGIGSALLSHIERHAGKIGIREILLWTDLRAVWAVSFYKRQGYTEVKSVNY